MCSPDQIIESLKITAPSHAAERLALSLEQLAESVSTWQAADSDALVIQAYFECEEDAQRARAALTAQLMALTDDPSCWSISYETLPATDWGNAWKAFFHVDRVSERIVTKPSWEPYEPLPNDCVIHIDPGMSFGTGQHETTRGCLQFIDQLTRTLESPISFLDLGCGSGILSIAAAKLGCLPVHAIDIDEDAIANARENMATNACSDLITVANGDVGKPLNMGAFTIVAANILAPVLIRHAANISRAVMPGGNLLLAGILTAQHADVIRAYDTLGMHEIETINDGDWISIHLAKTAGQGALIS